MWSCFDGHDGELDLVVADVMSSTLFGVIKSAAATIFVAFAENPEAGFRTHPQLCREMLAAWKKFLPDADLSFAEAAAPQATAQRTAPLPPGVTQQDHTAHA